MYIYTNCALVVKNSYLNENHLNNPQMTLLLNVIQRQMYLNVEVYISLHFRL